MISRLISSAPLLLKSNLDILGHRLYLELDLQSLFRLTVLIGRAPATPPPFPSSALGLVYEGAIGQPRKITSPCDPLF
jgi:hypothetical protein